jgi:4-amino-4-deoxy-L-arabinose transferase-like glycosyltransferase
MSQRQWRRSHKPSKNAGIRAVHAINVAVRAGHAPANLPMTSLFQTPRRALTTTALLSGSGGAVVSGTDDNKAGERLGSHVPPASPQTRVSAAQVLGHPAVSTPLPLVALAVLVFGVVWFATLGQRALIHPDEGRYASIALEMARSGDWITPRLNGLLYFEKPALQYWIGALFFHWLGPTEFAARLWPGLAGFLTLLLVGYTAGRLWGRETGVRALAIAASTAWIAANGHFLSLDAGLMFFLTLSLCAVLLAEQRNVPDAARRCWVWLAWAGMAGAVLSKGLVGLLIPGCVLLVSALWLRDFGLFRRLHWGSGTALFLVLTVPWFVLVSQRNPGFAEFFFVHEHFERYLSNVHKREGAWWYFVPILLAGLLPWTSALPWLGHHDRVEEPDAQRKARSVLIVWSVFVFVFFSASGSKLPSYILPMFPALALLIALRLRHVQAATLRWHLLVPALAWAAILLVSAQAQRFVSAGTPVEALMEFGRVTRVSGLVFFAAAALGWWLLTRQRVTAAVLCVALGNLGATLMALQAHNAFNEVKSAERLAGTLRPLIDDRAPIFALRSYDQTMPFYLRRSVVLVDYVDEFAFGQQREPAKAIATLDAFVERWQALPQAAAYMAAGTWHELRERGVPMRLVYQDTRRLVVLRR